MPNVEGRAQSLIKGGKAWQEDQWLATKWSRCFSFTGIHTHNHDLGNDCALEMVVSFVRTSLLSSFMTKTKGGYFGK